jgi:hypothetical protein
MKIVLEFTFPEQYARVARNEAHVRLVSSLWYASCYLIFLSVFGLVASVAANLLPFVFVVPHSFICLLVLLMQLIALGGLVRIKSSIEQSLHYMRIREIVFVFAEFHCASQIAPEIIDLLPRAPREPEEDGICEFP